MQDQSLLFAQASPAQSSSEPYIIKTGKHQDKCPAQMIWANPQEVFGLKSFLEKKIVGRDGKVGKNSLLEYIQWILRQDKSRETKELCPICKKRLVTHFSVLKGSSGALSYSPAYTCCDDRDCQRILMGYAIGKPQWTLPIKFSSLKGFSKSDAKRMIAIFRWAYKMPKRISMKVAHDFFAE